eukprot:1158448-Pelagomonas_calceolata.AAC.3
MTAARPGGHVPQFRSHLRGVSGPSQLHGMHGKLERCIAGRSCYGGSSSSCTFAKVAATAALLHWRQQQVWGPQMRTNERCNLVERHIKREHTQLL